MKIYFDHEKLDVYRSSNRLLRLGWRFPGQYCGQAAAKDQPDRASTSVPLNIAEGNAKFSHADRSRFFEIARGSAVECAACLDVLVARKVAKQDIVNERKEQLVRIVEMLIGLSRRFCGRSDRIREQGAPWPLEHEHDYEHEGKQKQNTARSGTT